MQMRATWLEFVMKNVYPAEDSVDNGSFFLAIFAEQKGWMTKTES